MEALISGLDHSKPPSSISASLQHIYFDTSTDNSSKTGVLATSVASSPNGKTITSASYDMTVKLWNPNTEDGSLRVFSGHTARVTSVAWSPNGKFIVSGSDDTTVRIWDAQTGKYVLPPLSIITDHVLSVAWSPDGTYIAAAGADADKAVWIWDASTGKKLYRWLTSQVVWSVAWSNTGKDVAAANADEKLLIYNVVTSKLIYSDRREPPGKQPKLHIAWSHNGKFLAAGGDDSMIYAWSWDANQDSPPIRELHGVYQGYTATVNSLDWSPDDQYLLSGSDDTTFCIWDASNISDSSVKKPLYQSVPDQGHGSVNTVAWLRDDSRRIVLGRETGHIEVWQIF